MKKTINAKISLRWLVLIIAAICMPHIHANQSLWVGQTFTWDVSSYVMGITYNLSWRSNGVNLKLEGSGFYRDITPEYYYSGTETVIVEWDYKLTYSSRLEHARHELTIECRDNKISISPTRMELAPGETAYISYSHQFNNQYESAAKVSFNPSSSCISVDRNGMVTALEPGKADVTVYSRISSVSPFCTVVVKEVQPQRATISDVSIDADASRTLDVSVSPANASVKNTHWSIVDGEDVISLTSGGTLTGKKPGTAHIKCTVNNSVTSNIAKVTVSEPPFSVRSTYPENDAKGVNVFTVPSISYSLAVFKGANFDQIYLRDMASGKNVEGQVQIDGSTIKFTSSKPLLPNTLYKLSVPASAVKNKWGTGYGKETALLFTTGDRDQIKLTVSPASGSFLSATTDSITIKADVPEAKIYYTLDGSNPTENSPLYKKALSIDRDVTLKCFASAEGYNDSEIVTATYYLSHCEVIDVFPKDADSLYVYDFVIPYVAYSGNVNKDDNFRKITLTDADGNKIAGEPQKYANAVAFVPASPLNNAAKYTLTIPAGAVSAPNGEQNTTFTHSFSTRNIAVRIALAGDETAMLVNEQGNLHAWGLNFKDMEPDSWLFTYSDQSQQWSVTANVSDIDGGATHRLYLNADGELYGWGRQYCGELGQALNKATVNRVKIASNVKTFSAGCQTTAFVTTSGELWMLGRNDFGQLGNDKTTSTQTAVKVMDNVAEVSAGNGFTLALTTSGEVWAWGRNHCGQLGDGTTTDRLTPVKIMDDASHVYASKSTLPFAAAKGNDGSLWMWGDNSAGQLNQESKSNYTAPVKVTDDVIKVALGGKHTLALKEDNQLYGWGDTSNNQIPSSDDNGTSIMQHVADMAAGDDLSLVLMLDGSVYGNGLNSHKLLGDDAVSVERPSVIFPGNGRESLSGVTFYHDEIIIVPEEEAIAICHVLPLNADYNAMEWACENSEIASVDEKGVITGNSFGHTSVSVTVTDRWFNSHTATCPVWVQTPEEAAGIFAVENGNSWEAKIIDHVLHIDGATEGNVYVIYNLQGIVIANIVADSNHCEFPLETSGIYIVKSGTRAVKLICL